MVRSARRLPLKGHPKVVEYLKLLLRSQLAMRDQYFVHSRRYEEMGLQPLYERLDQEMHRKIANADALLRRILFLEGDPDMRPKDFVVGQTVENMMRLDLVQEFRMRSLLLTGEGLCERLGDFVSREILNLQLQDAEENHTYWLEQQASLIEILGMQNYLAARMAQKGK